MGAPILIAERLRLVRGRRLVLHEVELGLAPGRVYVVIGPNGAGKSTLLLALAGLLKPEAGVVRLHGEPVQAMPPKRRACLLAWRGAPAEVELGLSLRDRLALARAHARGIPVEEAAQRFGLQDKLDRPLAALSLGERARAELASLFVQDAPVWLLDEPTAHLDAAWAGRTLYVLREEAQRGRLIVLVLHDLAQAQAIADEVVLVGGGRACACTPQRAWCRETLMDLYGVPFACWLRDPQRLWLPNWEHAASLQPHHDSEGEHP